MILEGVLAKIAFGIWTQMINTNVGFEARRLLSQAHNDDGTGGSKDIDVIIPLNRHSIFEELEDNMLLPMQMQLSIELNNGDEVLHKAHAAADGRVVVNRFVLWVPKMSPKDSLFNKFLDKFKKPTTWTYLSQFYEVSAPTRTSGLCYVFNF